MKSLVLSALASISLIACQAVPSETPAFPFDLSDLKGPKIGKKNEVMVLGTPHLSNFPDSFELENLSPLLNRLESWTPEMIMVETVSGSQCEYMRLNAYRYAESVEYYCWDSAPAKAATGYSVAEAMPLINEMLESWPETQTPAQRRKLASLFLASGDRTSALVQWLYLSQADRRAGDGLDNNLVEVLNGLVTRTGENYSIAAPLAVRLGLQRVYLYDDHTADSPNDDSDAFGKALTKAWDNPATAQRSANDKALKENLNAPDGIMSLYRYHNNPAQAELIYRSDFGAALEDVSPQKYGRDYLTYWETRNLRMAANIREEFRANSGARALVIVGASHKGYLDDYLHRMHDVKVIDTGDVLR